MGWTLSWALLMMLPKTVFAMLWNKQAFLSTRLEDAYASLGIQKIEPSSEVLLKAPDVAENGAIVQIQVESQIPHTDKIFIFAEHNPTQLIAVFSFLEGTPPFVVTRIKMAETTDVIAIVQSGAGYWMARKKVEVLENGCG